MTEFYNSIPEGIRAKLQEYIEKYSTRTTLKLENRKSISDLFTWKFTPEGIDFWQKHEINKTFPIWSEKQNKFINP
jgi:hypothetical protein